MPESTDQNSLWKSILPSAFGSIGSIVGGIINRGQARRDIAEQNAYNHPKAQLARLREAGLPMAAMTGGNVGNQSSLPTSHSGTQIGEGVGKIGNYITTQMQLKQLKILDEEIRLKGTEADKNEAERDWLLSGRGEDRAGTNLTGMLKTRLNTSMLTEASQRITNALQNIDLSFRGAEKSLNIDKVRTDIASTLQGISSSLTQQEGNTISNDMARIALQFKGRMSLEDWKRAIKSNALLDKSLEEKDQDIFAKALSNSLSTLTFGESVREKQIHVAIQELQHTKLGMELKALGKWYEFVQESQKLFDPKEATLNPIEIGRRLSAFGYTTISNLTGGSPGATSILSTLK